VGTIWEASKLGGLNIKEYLQPRNVSAVKSSTREKLEADPIYSWGRPMTRRKKQVNALRGTAGVRDQTSEERYADNNVGKVPGAAGPGKTPAKTPRTRSKKPK
jgi:hypothetical protein